MVQRAHVWGVGTAVIGVGISVMVAGPAWAHVDPNVPVGGQSVAGPSTVARYGQAVSSGQESAGGGVAWYLAAAVVGVLIMSAVWAGLRVLRRRQIAGAGVSAASAADEVEAELQRITAASRAESRGGSGTGLQTRALL